MLEMIDSRSVQPVKMNVAVVEGAPWDEEGAWSQGGSRSRVWIL